MAVCRVEIKQAVDDGLIEYLGHVDDVQEAGPVQRLCAPVLARRHTTGVLAMSTGRAVITTDARGCRETSKRVRTDCSCH